MKLYGALTMALTYDNYYARLGGQQVETRPEQPDIGCYAYYSKQLKRTVAVWYKPNDGEDPLLPGEDPAAEGYKPRPIACIYDGEPIKQYETNPGVVAWAPLWVWAAKKPIKSTDYKFLLQNGHLPNEHPAADRQYTKPTLVVDNTPSAPTEPSSEPAPAA
jgi:hypothetical protein